MSDISEEKFNDMVGTLVKISGSLGKIVDKMGSSASSGKSTSRSSAKKTIEDEINVRKKDSDSLKDHFQRVQDSAGTFKALKSSMVKFTEGFVGVEVIKKVVQLGAENAKVYQDLSNYGQSFGGSMIKMAQQAGAAGLPLTTFAEVIKKNTLVVGQMGSDAFFKLNKQVRTLTESSGMYGYTVEQLADVQGMFLDQQRLAGKNLKDLTSPATARDIADFALNVSTISDVLHTSREETLANAKNAMSDTSFLAQERINTINGMGGLNKSFQAAITDLSAQAGEGGKALSTALAQSAGPLGANFSDLGKALNSVGQGQLVGALQNASAAIKAGADGHAVAQQLAADFHDQLNKPEVLQQLAILRQSGGAAAGAAGELIQLATSVQKYTDADRAKAAQERKRQDGITAFFTSFQSILGRVQGAFVDGFLKPFTDAFGSMDSQAAKDFWKVIQDDLEPAAKDLGAAFGSFIKNFLTKENIDSLINTTRQIINFGIWIGKVSASLINGLMPVVKFVVGTFTLLHKNLMLLGKNFADFGTTMVGVIAFLAGPILLKMVAGALLRAIFQSGSPVFVSGKIVTVTGGGGVGGAAAEAEAVAKAEAGTVAKAGEKAAVAAAEKSAAKGFLGKAAGGIAAAAGKLVPPAAKGFLGKAAGGVGAAASKFIPSAAKGFLGKAAGGIGAAASKFAPKALLDILSKAGPKAIPLIGTLAAMGISGFAEFNDSHNLAKALFVAAGSGAGTLVGQAIGAAAGPAGEVYGTVAGGMAGEAGGGMLYDAMFGKGKGAKDSTAGAENKGTTDKAATPDKAAPADAGTDAKPVTLDDDAILKLKTDALLGDQTANDILKKLSQSVDRHTAILTALQRQQIQATKGVGQAVAAGQGY
jgi:hypothetical protein